VPATTAPAPPARPPAPRRALDAASACVQFALTAGTVDTATGDLGQSRQAAARALGTSQLQALFRDTGQGRSTELQTERLHRARVTATAVPDDHSADGADDAPAMAERYRPRSPVAVTVSDTARGADGWTAAVAPYRLDCLTVSDPAVGRLVDDVAVTALLPAPGAG
jgi:hypothetical protein